MKRDAHFRKQASDYEARGLNADHFGNAQVGGLKIEIAKMKEVNTGLLSNAETLRDQLLRSEDIRIHQEKLIASLNS